MSSPDRPGSFSLHLADEAATARLGAALAAVLRPGDLVLLWGDLGAGKSALARAVIAALLDDPRAEIPSPSYTLVNVYDTPAGAVWHADLYRLSGEADEIAELGLDEAMAGGTDGPLVLVEWPERLGTGLPARRLEISLTVPKAGEGRDLQARPVGPGWEAVAGVLAGWV